VLAAAEVQRFIVFRRVRQRGEIATLVGAVAEWLIAALAARTPEVLLSGFYVDGVGSFLGDGRGAHIIFP
jgi:hypothetical protein